MDNYWDGYNIVTIHLTEAIFGKPFLIQHHTILNSQKKHAENA